MIAATKIAAALMIDHLGAHDGHRTEVERTGRMVLRSVSLRGVHAEA